MYLFRSCNRRRPADPCPDGDVRALLLVVPRFGPARADRVLDRCRIARVQTIGGFSVRGAKTTVYSCRFAPISRLNPGLAPLRPSAQRRQRNRSPNGADSADADSRRVSLHTHCRGAVLRALLILLVAGQEEEGGLICCCDQEAAKPERLLGAERDQHRLLDPVLPVALQAAARRYSRIRPPSRSRRWTAIAYAEEGARVAVTYANDAAAAERTLARLRDSGCEPLAFPLDLSEPESIEACLIEVTAAFGGLATSSSPTPSAGLSTRESHLPTPTVQPGRAPSARTSRARRPRCGSRFRTSRDRAQAASS